MDVLTRSRRTEPREEGDDVLEEHIIILYIPGETPMRYNLDAFRKDTVMMGRGQYHGKSGLINDIAIPESISVVSKAHCSFQQDRAGEWYIVDDGSMNGLLFNGERVSLHKLNDGDQFSVGTDVANRLILVYSILTQAPEIDTSSLMQFPLKNIRECSIGRDEKCDIVIRHPTVSRKHCFITNENGNYYVVDNQSTNGVLLNSRVLNGKARLNPMDRINIGGTTIIFNGNALYYQVQGGGVGIVVEHVTKQVGNDRAKKKGKQRKTILDDISLTIQPNRFVAIIGGSGAGKTTLLECVSGMSELSSGNVYINGESIRSSGKHVRSLMGYVPQQDIVYDALTLERMLMYSAKLRMPSDTSEKEIRKKINEILSVVELTEHRHTMISKLSGGQKKRASIAVELLASPKVFFLDEPSSGLDPGTEKHLMHMLKQLAATGKTVVMVTHTVQNIDLCDEVVCMGKGGRLCFAGTPSQALQFFGKQRMTDVYDELNERSEIWAKRYREYRSLDRKEDAGSKGKSEKEKRRSSGAFRQFSVMTRRYSEMLVNDKGRLILLLAMPVVLALLVCFAFEADGNLSNVLTRFMRKWVKSVTSLKSTFPFLRTDDTMKMMFTFSCAVFWTGIFNSIQEISKERPIYQRERFSGVGVVPYIFSKIVPLSLLCLIQSAIMTAILSFMTNTTATFYGNLKESGAIAMGMRTDGLILGPGMMWLETLITTFLCAMSAMSMGLLISTLVSNEIALVLCPICLMPQILFSGIVVDLSGMAGALSNIISCKWSCAAYLISARVNELYKKVNTVYTPTPGYEAVPFGDGDIKKYAFDANHKYIFKLATGDGVVSGWFVLFLICVICTVAAILVLRFKRNKTR